ncbi:hypothetical protein I3760_12G067900 [Carya illinoinensis]|nr:hypothetical protein I3760_12G067900 [Carya illinoinensis]
MAEETSDIQTVLQYPMSSPVPRPLRDNGEDDIANTPDVQNMAMKMERAEKAYMKYEGQQEGKPAGLEVWGWYLYEFCSYFVHSVLIPIVFPLIISQVVSRPPEPEQGWSKNSRGFVCTQKEMKQYQSLTLRSIKISNSTRLSPLEWTSLSWAIGLIVAAPVLGFVSFRLDRGRQQLFIAASSIAVGVVFCLPAGFFKTVWIFLPYIVAIVAAHTIARSCHTRHLGLMVRGFTGPNIPERQFPTRRAISGWFSLYGTVAGCAGSAIIAAFTYHMLRESPDEELLSLWVVSIFSGLMWLVGIFHVVTSAARIFKDDTPPQSRSHALSIFKYPHAIESLAGVFLSSFTTMCIFTGGVLFLVGQLCLKPTFLLYFWFIYFIFPLFSLPLLQPLQHLIKADAVKMQLLGFFISAATTGVGFYYKGSNWKRHSVLFFAAAQGTSTGLLHAFGRVLLLDCSPPGKEGAFSLWFSWMKALGAFAGFTVASVVPGNIGTSFGTAFFTALLGIVMLIFGNLSDFGGAVAAGHVRSSDDDSEKGSPKHSMDHGGMQVKELEHGELTP